MNRIILFILIMVLFSISISCSGDGGRAVVERKPATTDLPYFASLEWPPTCSELPEGRLVITGTLVFPGGPDPEGPVMMFVFADPGNCTGVGEKGSESENGGGESNPSKIPYIQELESKVLHFLEGRHKGEKSTDEFPKGCQGYGLFYDDNNEYRYFHPENGRFRIDFDQWCRFTPGDKILILAGLDTYANGVVATNIYRVPHYAVDAYAATVQVRNEYGAMMTYFCQAILDALAFYPLERHIDIETITATRDLYAQAYLGNTVMTNYRAIGEAYGQRADLIAQNISNPNFREAFILVADYIEEEFIFNGDVANASHFQRLFAESDPTQNFMDSAWKLEDLYTQCPITTQREILPPVGLKVTLDILRGEAPLAHIVMSGSPSSLLVVTGNIGNHTIVGDDYNPYFIKMFGLLYEEGFVPIIGY